MSDDYKDEPLPEGVWGCVLELRNHETAIPYFRFWSRSGWSTGRGVLVGAGDIWAPWRWIISPADVADMLERREAPKPETDESQPSPYDTTTKHTTPLPEAPDGCRLRILWSKKDPTTYLSNGRMWHPEPGQNPYAVWQTFGARVEVPWSWLVPPRREGVAEEPTPATTRTPYQEVVAERDALLRTLRRLEEERDALLRTLRRLVEERDALLRTLRRLEQEPWQERHRRYIEQATALADAALVDGLRQGPLEGIVALTALARELREANQ